MSDTFACEIPSLVPMPHFGSSSKSKGLAALFRSLRAISSKDGDRTLLLIPFSNSLGSMKFCFDTLPALEKACHLVTGFIALHDDPGCCIASVQVNDLSTRTGLQTMFENSNLLNWEMAWAYKNAEDVDNIHASVEISCVQGWCCLESMISDLNSVLDWKCLLDGLDVVVVRQTDCETFETLKRDGSGKFRLSY